MLRKVEYIEDKKEDLKDIPTDFVQALMSIKSCNIPKETHVKEIPLKPTIAPYCAGITAHTDNSDPMFADGKFILLYDPIPQEGWNSNFRIITMFSTFLSQDLLEESLIGQVAWSWLGESLEKHKSTYVNLTGTVTKHQTDAFGGLILKNQQGKIEIRASWSPIFDTNNINLSNHFLSFCNMLDILSGRQLSSPYLQAI